MNIYKKFKGMKKSAKLGLISAGIYVASGLAVPALAGQVTEKQTIETPVVEQISIEHLTTSEQAENFYKEKMKGYAGDKLLTFAELENLYKIQSVKVDLLKQENHDIIDEYKKKTEPITKLDAKINEANKKLSETYSGSIVSPFSELSEKFETSILRYYPSLIDKEGANVTYSAETKIKPKLIATFRGLVLEADKVLKVHYKDTTLELLVNEDEYTISDVLTLYKAIHERRGDYTYVEKIRKELEDKISLLENQKAEIINSEQMIPWREKINAFYAELEGNSVFVKTFESYSNLKEDVKKFEENYGNFNNQFSISLVKQKLLKYEGMLDYGKIDGLGVYAKRFKNIQEDSISRFKEFAKNEGLEVEIEKTKNPAKTIVPWWLGLVLGSSIPLIRNLVVRGYVQGSDSEPEGYVVSACAGAFNGLIGVIFLDGLHPLVFPIRMLTPFVFQPLFKLFKTDPAQEFADNI